MQFGIYSMGDDAFVATAQGDLLSFANKNLAEDRGLVISANCPCQLTIRQLTKTSYEGYRAILDPSGLKIRSVRRFSIPG